jgi:hypothetical protein
MSRPVQPIGTFGTIAVRKVRERTSMRAPGSAPTTVVTFGSAQPAPPTELLSAS